MNMCFYHIVVLIFAVEFSLDYKHVDTDRIFTLKDFFINQMHFPEKHIYYQYSFL